jgi:spermidine/putrescine transport system substrate-binding protein
MDTKKTSNGRARKLCLGLAVMVAALALAACGGGGGIEGGSDSGSVSTVKLSPPPSGDLSISNWPDYIDSKTVAEFEQATGIKTTYTEDVNDNAEFFAKVQQLLAKGQSGGRSVMVVTDWMAKKMYDLGYLQDLDKSGIPNVEANLRPDLKSPDFDPDRKFSVPWQSGMTGLIVDKTKAPDVHSICDLFDPQYKGQVEMLTELRDTVPLVMKCMGVDPNDASQDDWLAAIDKIKGAVDQGQIRRFAGNDYTRDMANGDATAIIGWSGDAEQLKADNPNIEFRMPTEGCILWSDNMVIPVGAPNPTAAEAWMNYVYDPANQAQIAEYVNYITPVTGVDKVLGQKDPALLKDQLIFPTEEYTKNCSVQPNITGEEEATVTKAFEGVLNG